MVSFLAVGVKFQSPHASIRSVSRRRPASLRTTVGRSRPGRAEDQAPPCATSGRAEIPGLKEFMVTRIQGFGNRAFAIGERYRERTIRASLYGGKRRSRSALRTQSGEHACRRE